MNGGLGGGEDSQTPLDDDDLPGLRLTYVATRGELDAAEQANIVAGRRWATSRRRSLAQLLDDLFVRNLHREMFGDVWTWAGKYRKSDKNIGVEWQRVPESVRNLCADTAVWFESASDELAWDVAAIEFHHRLVLIHPFANGNGRHARFMADALRIATGGTAFTWGGTLSAMSTQTRDPSRTAYLEALRSADRGDSAPLVAFARS